MGQFVEEEDSPPAAGWIVSYADLMTLLFAAFVVLYGLKQEGEKVSIKGVTSNIREAFINIPDEIPKDQRKGPIKQGISSYQHFRGETMATPFIQRYKRASNALEVIDDDVDDLQKIVKEINSDLEKSGKSQEAKSPIEITRYDNEIRLRILSSLLFKPGESKLRPENLDRLSQIGQKLKKINQVLVVEGHTDSSGSGGGNWELSVARASYLARFLDTRVGVPRSKISASGFADTRPIASNSTEAGRSLNRRVEIKIQYGNR